MEKIRFEKIREELMILAPKPRNSQLSTTIVYKYENTWQNRPRIQNCEHCLQRVVNPKHIIKLIPRREIFCKTQADCPISSRVSWHI